jgi:hypothetical protein
MVNQMSKYTTQIRWLVETLTPDSPGLSIDQRIDKAAPLIFNFNFPIFEESYRPILEHKILLHYYMREIGQETVALWKLSLNERLNLIMPYYNTLYTALQEKYKIMGDVDLEELYLGNRDETGKFTGNTNANASDDGSTTGQTMASDFPQAAVVGSKDYYSGSTESKADSNNTTTSETKTDNTNTITSDENHISKKSGLSGLRMRGQILADYSQDLFNIDMRIIKELADLFFLLY